MMKFNETGTLIDWQLDEIDIIAPLHSKEGGGSRGGVYLCIPNFEELSPPFSIKHGEYRQTACDSKLPHQKKLSSPAGHNWGSIDIVTDWEEFTEQNGKTLQVTSTIRAISDMALIRPGFHPYFSISENSFIEIGANRIDIASLPHDKMQVFQVASIFEAAKLTTDFYSVLIDCQLAPLSENLSLAFVVWSDKKHAYVCIEPVIGNHASQDGLPSPLTLTENEVLEMIFTTRVIRSNFSTNLA
jgi:hypothetical protein